jgi:cytochrome c peroxidase
MRQTMKNLKGTGLGDDEYAALDAWLVAMKGPPSLSRPLDAVEQRGHAVFTDDATGCNSCHAEGAGFTDHALHDVSSATFADKDRYFLAPSLRFVGQTAPYFHDGRYATLYDLLTRVGDTMGNAASLSQDEVTALEAYLKTL